MHEEEPPRFGWDHSTIFERGFPAVYFDRSESVFWCVIRTHNEKFEIQLRAADARTVLDRIETEDPFGDSLFSFHPTNNENLVALWIAAGQDGQTIHWLESDGGRIIHRPEDAFLETTPPAFAPDGSEFLILDGEGRIARYRYPTAKIADCPWPFGDEDCFAGYMAYIDQTSAIVISNNGRTFLLDVPTMTIADEIVIENHPPRPVPRIYYPSRYVDELCTDLRFFERIGDNFLFVYEDSLLVVPAAEFLSAPRPHK
ncbi:MAG: hypothetical protein JSS81_19005 [Acidobacteria bacterium]|nr:hypothetical protein [Acidobacteriota bacterium]